jgi:hypothetical protein
VGNPTARSGARLKTMTSCPSAARLSVNARPINPVPPVMITRIATSHSFFD